MSDNKVDLEMKKIFDVAAKKGSINEEEVYFRLLKYDLSALEIQKFIKKIESHSIKILKSTEESEIENEELEFTGFMSVDDPVKMYLKDIERCHFLQLKKRLSLQRRFWKEMLRLRQDCVRQTSGL